MKKLLLRIHHIPFIVIGVAVIALSIGLVLTLLQKSVPARVGTGDIYLTRYEVQAAKDQTVSFTVRISPGTKVDAVTTTLEYNPDDLEYKSTSYEGSPFTTQIPATKQSHTVTVQAARMGGETVSSDSVVAALTFTAKKDGNHAVSLNTGNAAYNGMPTHPLVAGKVVASSADDCNGANCTAAGISSEDKTAKAAASQPANGSAVLLSPIEQVLQAAGLNAESARRSAPWVLGLVTCIILALLFGGYLLIAKRRQLWPFVPKSITIQGVSQ